MAQSTVFKKYLKKIKRSLRQYTVLYLVGAIALIGGIYAYMNIPPTINPAAYTPLLNLIAEGESNGNYNAHFGDSASTVRFTEMTVDEVLAWQTEFVAQGNPSNAVGRYQIIQPTLEGLVEERRLDGTEVFNPALQDSLAITLMERRGSKEFATDKITSAQFEHNLSQEWAALPKALGDNPEESYYAGDGLNAAHVSIDQINQATSSFRRNIID